MSLQSLNDKANKALQDKVAAPLNALGAKLTATVNRELALNWHTPKTKKGLLAMLSAYESLTATIQVTTTAGNGAPAKAGTKTDALSLGVGISASAAAKISLGLSLGIGFSASGSIGLQLVVAIQSAIASHGALDGALVSYNAKAKLNAGAKGTFAPGFKLDDAEISKALRGVNDKLGDCQSKADAATDGQDAEPISAELHHPRMGVWECSLDLDAEVAQRGKLKFKLDDIEWKGTVIPDQSGTDGARSKCRVVGGNGSLSKIIAAHSYSGGGSVKVRLIVHDILKEVGEDLSDLSDGPTLDRELPRWHVSGGSARQALTALAEATDTAWRVLRDGTVWFGAETWPEVAPEGVLTHESWADGHLVLAAETPDMVPGTVYQGQRVEHVTHVYGTTLRTHIRTQSGSAVSALSGLLKNKRHIDFSREYPCKVVTQNPDGTLQLLPDDEIMQSGGLDHVPIRYGLPGVKAKISNGARCHLAFAAGDQTRPFVTSWEYDPDTVVLNSIFDGAQSLSRVGDLVTSGGPGLVCTLMPLALVGAPPNNAIAAGMPCMISFSAIPPFTPADQIPLYGAISSGIPKFQG